MRPVGVLESMLAAVYKTLKRRGKKSSGIGPHRRKERHESGDTSPWPSLIPHTPGNTQSLKSTVSTKLSRAAEAGGQSGKWQQCRGKGRGGGSATNMASGVGNTQH
jgi:hypothetical protein